MYFIVGWMRVLDVLSCQAGGNVRENGGAGVCVGVMLGGHGSGVSFPLRREAEEVESWGEGNILLVLKRGGD